MSSYVGMVIHNLVRYVHVKEKKRGTSKVDSDGHAEGVFKLKRDVHFTHHSRNLTAPKLL